MNEKKSPSREFTLPVRVYIEDTDAGGIVYYVNYLKFMERARTEYLRSLGYQHYALAKEDFQFVVRGAQVQYRQPAKIDDALHVSAQLTKIGKASLAFTQRVLRDDSVLCEANIEVACVAASTLKPVAMPSALFEQFQAALD